MPNSKVRSTLYFQNASGNANATPRGNHYSTSFFDVSANKLCCPRHVCPTFLSREAVGDSNGNIDRPPETVETARNHYSPKASPV
ncbi:hypothetical protein VD0002_g8059 [Verticillium dahliae]|uniref:Uncharacterized protein n=1 Tax=Verticillium dahliae TaxID=27337 RepID=A0AA44WP35_VERDA|nr:hypothetical protein BJF96_g1928 [Verticillium dahliae]PNH59497.1 hypothetical protein VD0002_g8059 [Verticillium dahliae]